MEQACPVKTYHLRCIYCGARYIIKAKDEDHLVFRLRRSYNCNKGLHTFNPNAAYYLTIENVS